MLSPKKTKYKKRQKGKNYNRVSSVVLLNANLRYGCLGLKALTAGSLTSKQLISIKQCISKISKKFGRLKFHIFPHLPVTRKPIEVRMGKGKGAVYFWVSKLQVGTLICELQITNFFIGLKALRAAQFRLPIKTKIIIKK